MRWRVREEFWCGEKGWSGFSGVMRRITDAVREVEKGRNGDLRLGWGYFFRRG